MDEAMRKDGGTLDGILTRHKGAGREHLIPILQEVQDACGFLSRETVRVIGDFLGLPESKIYGVATFYNQFRFQPQGRYHIQVCRGTACHVKGSAAIQDIVERELKLKAGQTGRDGMFSIEVVACMGACGLAPVITVNGEYHANLTPEKIRRLIAEHKGKAMNENKR